MNKARYKFHCLKNAFHIFRHYMRWPYPIYKPGRYDNFNHEHTCIVAKLANIELKDICPLTKEKKQFMVAQEDECETCKYFCRIHYEIDPEYGEKQLHFWLNEDIATFL